MDVWVDFEDIPPASRWAEDLKQAIEGSDAFVFVISPDSVVSPECNAELERAAALNKRIVPLHLREVDPGLLPDPLSTHNWVPQLGLFEEDFARSMDALVTAIETDLDWVGEHTRWGQKAIEWDEHQRDRSFLLSGSELATAEQWLARQSGKHPEPTDLQNAYVLASRQEATRRLRRTRAFVSVALVVAVALSIVALAQRDTAVSNERTAQSRQLAAEAESKLGSDPELSAMLALRALDVRYTTQAEAALRDALPDVQELKTFTVGSPVNSAVFSPDGTKVLTASDDGTARIWQAATGRVLTIVHGPRLTGFRASYSPDGTKFVTNSADGQATIWDAATGRRLLVLHGPDTAVNAVNFSPDGKKIVTADANGTAIVWSATTGRQLSVIRYRAAINDANFSPDATKVVTADADDTAIIWNATTATEIKALEGHTEEVLTAAFSPNGSKIVTASADETAIVWSATTGKELTILEGHKDLVNSAAFSPDGSEVVTAGNDATATVWDASSGEPLAELRGHEAPVVTAAFSPDGHELLTASDDGTAKIWTSAPREQRLLLTGIPHGFASSVAFSPSGEQFVTADARSEAGREYGTATIWDTVGGQRLAVLHGDTGEVTDAVFSPDASRIATAGNDGNAIIWSALTDKALVVLPNPAPVDSVEFNRTGTRVLTASGEDAMIWNAASGQLLQTLSDPAVVRGLGVSDAAFSPDGKEVVTADDDGTAIVWNATSAKPRFVLDGDTATVNHASFSPNGDRIVTSSFDHLAIIWNAATGKRLETLEGNAGPVLDAQFSPDGDKVATADAYGTAIIWSVATASPLTVLQAGVANPLLDGGANPVDSAVFSPNGRELATASIAAGPLPGVAETVSIWSTETSGQITALERIADTRVTRQFTPLEQKVLLAGIGG
jgi:WD40 repeat protein